MAQTKQRARSAAQVAAAIRTCSAVLRARRLIARRKASGPLSLGRLAAALTLALCWYDVPPAQAAASGFLCESQMTKAAQAYGIPIRILYSVGLTETGHAGELSPYDMNVDGRSVHSQSLPEALAKFENERARGARFIDIGCMQINHHYHAQNFGSLSEMFDPARNVDYAASFLKRLREQEGSWTMAVARYNAGPDNAAAQHKYVCAVIAHMVAGGVGAWTPQAQAFCQ